MVKEVQNSNANEINMKNFRSDRQMSSGFNTMDYMTGETQPGNSYMEGKGGGSIYSHMTTSRLYNPAKRRRNIPNPTDV